MEELSLPKVAPLLKLRGLQRLKKPELYFEKDVPPPPPELERECLKRAVELVMSRGKSCFLLTLGSFD